MDVQRRALSQLARLFRVEVACCDVFGKIRQPSPEALLSILNILGAPVDGLAAAPEALRVQRRALWQRCLEPVIVAWEGSGKVPLRLPASQADADLHYEIHLDTGAVINGVIALPTNGIRGKKIDGVRYVVVDFRLPHSVPLGYHRFRLQVNQTLHESLLIAASRRAYEPPVENHRQWGIFAPLYALHSKHSWGAGSFSDLDRIMDWTENLGGQTVATLPLLPTFLDPLFEPSPYSPVSRLYWNEFYVDPTRAAEFAECRSVTAQLNTLEFQRELASIRGASLVDYQRQMAQRRKVIEALLGCLLEKSSDRRDEFHRFIENHPRYDDYARFRALTESRRQPWMAWPQANRDGVINPGEYDENIRLYHLFAQWLADQQMSSLSEKARRQGVGLYLDFPLGVNTAGYDVWRHRDVFALGASGGAPPDLLCSQGQDWGFAPFHPERIRKAEYRYYINSLRHHLKHAGRLRLDHVMGLHRLFWVPSGWSATEGAYVHYRADEFYAILSLESHRYQACLVGENLGTVPAYVNAAISQHAIRATHVGQFNIQPDPNQAYEQPAPTVAASLNTHDLPTFAAFWEGLDIGDRFASGLIDEAAACQEREARARLKEALTGYLNKEGWLTSNVSDPEAVLAAWLAFLAAGPAELLLINLEDLWLETNPQNTPGTSRERPNWSRMTRYSFEDYSTDKQFLSILRAVNRLRRQPVKS